MNGILSYLLSPILWLSIGLFAQAVASMDTNADVRRLDASIAENVTRMDGNFARLERRIASIENLRGAGE